MQATTNLNTIPDVPTIKIEQTLERFDRVERKLPAWDNWEEQPGHEFVAARNDRSYPIKHIIAPSHRAK